MYNVGNVYSLDNSKIATIPDFIVAPISVTIRDICQILFVKL